MKKTNILLLTLIFLITIGIVNASGGQPIIHSMIITDPDNFYSNFTGNNIINIKANVSGVDLSNPSFNGIYVNFSGLENQSLGIIINCSGDGPIVNMSNETYGGDIYNASCDVGDEAASLNFQGGVIILIAFNINGPSSSPNNYATAVLYNMTTPENDPNGCMVFGPSTTNFSEELDFSDVNFTIEAKINLSCQLNQTIPILSWANDFETLAILNFESLNFTNPSTVMTLSNLPSALRIDINTPESFGDSEIYLDSALIGSLNTTSTIKLFHLPFTSQPTIEEEVIGGLNTSGIWSQGSGEGNLTFVVNHFSGYNITDTMAPVFSIISPINNFNTSSNSVLINLSINGTGTTLSYVNISIDGTQIGNLSNCTNISEIYTCAFNYDISNLANATHTLSIIARDFGGANGNLNTTTSSFTKDQIAPITIATGNSSNWKNTNFNITLSGFDNVSGIKYINYSINGTANATYANNITISAEGNYTLTYYAIDNAGNIESTKTLIILLDKTTPITNITGNSSNWVNTSVTLNFGVPTIGISGIAYTNYSINGATPITRNQVNITEEGTYLVQYYTVSNSGIIENAKNVTIRIDKSAATIEAGSDKSAKVTINTTGSERTTPASATSLSSNLIYSWFANSSNVTIATNTTLSTLINATVDGTYIIYFNVTNNVNGLSRLDNFTFTWDTTNPTAPSITKSISGTIYVGDSLTATCSATDNIGTPTCSCGSASTSSSGSNSVSCTSTDTAGNTNTSSLSYTVTAKASSVGSAAATTETTTPTQSTTLGSIPVNTPTDIEFTKSGLAVDNIELLLNVGETNARITVTNLDSRPESTVSVSSQNKDLAEIYKYIEIAHPSVENTHIKTAKISFKVEKSWLTTNKYKKEQVALYRYYNSEWKPLTTRVIKDDAKYYYFEAESSGLSYFAIGTKKETVTTTTETPKESTNVNNSTEKTQVTTTTTESNTTTKTDVATPQTKKSGGNGWIWFLTIVVIAGGIIGAYYYNKSRENIVIVKAKQHKVPVKVTSKEQYEEEHPKNE